MSGDLTFIEWHNELNIQLHVQFTTVTYLLCRIVLNVFVHILSVLDDKDFLHFISLNIFYSNTSYFEIHFSLQQIVEEDILKYSPCFMGHPVCTVHS